jgi:hypothetical protein
MNTLGLIIGSQNDKENMQFLKEITALEHFKRLNNSSLSATNVSGNIDLHSIHAEHRIILPSMGMSDFLLFLHELRLPPQSRHQSIRRGFIDSAYALFQFPGTICLRDVANWTHKTLRTRLEKENSYTAGLMKQRDQV